MLDFGEGDLDLGVESVGEGKKFLFVILFDKTFDDNLLDYLIYCYLWSVLTVKSLYSYNYFNFSLTSRFNL